VARCSLGGGGGGNTTVTGKNERKDGNLCSNFTDNYVHDNQELNQQSTHDIRVREINDNTFMPVV